MKQQEIINASKILFEHKLNKTGLDDLDNNLAPLNLADSYQIQEELKILYLTLQNNESLGKKIGVTNKEAAKQIGIDEPFYGNLFTRFSDINIKSLNSKNFHEPYLEPEISFRMKDDVNISLAPFNKNNITNLFDGIVCSIEIVDFRFNKPIDKIGPYNIIASNGASDYWIRHENIYPLNVINLENHEVKLFVDSKIHFEGNTNNVLENPLNAALWLINKLASQGEPMLKGQFISTGSCTKALKLDKGMHIQAEFGNLGSIEFDYI